MLLNCTAVVMVGTKKRGLFADNNLPHCSDSAIRQIFIFVQ